MKIKKGDHVIVVAGRDRGRTGMVIAAYPDRGKVLVQGVNVVKKHQKATRATMQAGIIDKDMPIDASNVAIVSRGQASRIGYRIDDNGTKVRVARRSGKDL